MGPRNHLLEGGSDHLWEGAILGKGAPTVKYRDTLQLLVPVQKRLNRLIWHLGCGLQLAEGSTSSIVLARWCQCTKFQLYSPGGANVPDNTLLSTCQLRKNGRTDRFTIWVVDSGGPKEAQVQSYSPGGANMPTWDGTLVTPGEHNTVGNFSSHFHCYLWTSGHNSDIIIFWHHHSTLRPDFLKKRTDKMVQSTKNVFQLHFLCFWPFFCCRCAEVALFRLPVWNLTLPSFSAALISCEKIEILAEWRHFAQLLAVFPMCMHRNDYLWASSQNYDTNIQFNDPNFLSFVIHLLCFWPFLHCSCT